MKALYKTNDWDKLSGSRMEGHLPIKERLVPFVVFSNEPEKTDDPAKLGPALEQVLGRLYQLQAG
jgi:hypothetical protein